MKQLTRSTQRFALIIATSFALTCLPARLAVASPEIPGAPQKDPIAIVNATVHPVDGSVIPNATVVFENGKITQVGTDVVLPTDTQTRDGKGLHVYPGLFNTDGALGLIEINSVRATDDRAEVGRINANVRADIAVNPDSELIPVTRSGGVLLNLTTPSGGLVSGQSAILQLDGWTTEDLTLKSSAGMHLHWPRLVDNEHHHEHGKNEESQEKQLTAIEEFFQQAESYDQARAATPSLPVDLRFESMRAVLSKEIPLIVSANRAPEIRSAVAFAADRNLKLIIYGGEDAVECAELLRSQQVPVIISGVYRLPTRRDSAYDERFTLPARLLKEKIKFCISGYGRFDAPQIRNLPYHAAMAVAFGLPAEEALRAITLSPAEILGVQDRVGSLSPGKDATLIVANGDIFDTATNVVDAYVQGRHVDLSDRHKRLFRKYEARQEQEK